jgi:uncharacterized protein YjiS (DUF1127 family)
MFAIFREDRVTQTLYRSAGIGRAEMSRERSCGPDRIPQETQWLVSPLQLSGILNGVGAVLREWRWREKGRLELARLDERMLRDIGLTRAEADNEIKKPFWRE